MVANLMASAWFIGKLPSGHRSIIMVAGQVDWTLAYLEVADILQH